MLLLAAPTPEISLNSTVDYRVELREPFRLSEHLGGQCLAVKLSLRCMSIWEDSAKLVLYPGITIHQVLSSAVAVIDRIAHMAQYAAHNALACAYTSRDCRQYFI